ncbi:hypothetical protein C461_13148 [Halorubrum aidingense JCM 13560]|uniref:Uncharacterized protein n=1 Tax=Halorubrum aidingense JCM 13560 TaxID=1230454 RepID=M0PBC7_9EURY|nr:DUF5784 family protein [Halorubrum aidingense]EMA66120.1 hypothetical protein C461_13148 [Halorubrum aidingense JCM 13560]
MAQPLRFRRAAGRWNADRVRSKLERPLDQNLGATAGDPWFSPPPGYTARRFDMDDGSFALFSWTDSDPDPPVGAAGEPAGYWLGNTETPSALWRTNKYGFDEVAYPLSRWAQRELLAGLHDDEPWLAAFPHVSWYFLPVFCSKDGSETTRAFFRDHAAGFPDATREAGTGFVEETLRPGTLDEYRETMAGKLGTSRSLDLVRMSATIAEFTAARILTDAGYEVTPEIEVTTGHSLDYRATDPDTGEASLVEVTRPQPVSGRSATDPVAAVRDTAETKTSGQLEAHGGGVTLFVDCTSFPDDDWAAVREAKPAVRHKPAVVLRARPNGHIEGYRKGAVPLDLSPAIEWVS